MAPPAGFGLARGVVRGPDEADQFELVGTAALAEHRWAHSLRTPAFTPASGARVQSEAEEERAAVAHR
jgi:hypothetical protein